MIVWNLETQCVRRHLSCAPWIACVAWAVGTPVRAAPPVNPLPTPLFSLDPSSPTLVFFAFLPGDILQGPGPTVAVPAANLGLTASDDLDALSGNQAGLSAGTFALLLSVDRNSVGAAPPDPLLAGTGLPYNVADQAARGHAAGDVFMSTVLFNTGGPVPGPGIRDDPRGNTILIINQFDEGGTFDLVPEATAGDYALDEEEDDVDGMQRDDTAKGRGGRDITGVYFSVRSGSPFALSGAHVFYDGTPGQPPAPALFATAGQLGLDPTNDDIDALVVFDVGTIGSFDAGDQILFSLAPLSASGAAVNVYTKTFGSPRQLFASAANLGLAASDNVDALELLACSDGRACAQERGVRSVAGDCDNNAIVDLADYACFVDCLAGPRQLLDTNGAATHVVDIDPGTDFTPASLVIEVGDTVQWLWQGGSHNVVSGRNGVFDGNFSSGPPTSVIGTTFDVTFGPLFVDGNHPMPANVYPYFCGVDGGTGVIAAAPHECATFDFNSDGHVDLEDFASFQEASADQ